MEKGAFGLDPGKLEVLCGRHFLCFCEGTIQSIKAVISLCSTRQTAIEVQFCVKRTFL